MTVVLHHLVHLDIAEAMEFYDLEGGAKLAADLFHEIEVALETVRERPFSLAPYNEVLRRTSVSRFPFHILFSIEPDHAFVLVVRHHRRHPDFGLNR